MSGIDVAAVGKALRAAYALPAGFYHGEETLALEQRSVFAPSWQLLAHAAQLAEPGDHVVEEIAGTPVLLLRGRDGVLRAFVNVCRHRAGPLATCNGKGLHTLRCRYHGWLYDQQGRLLAAPEMQEADGFRTDEVRLPALSVREWEGLVFVALRGDGAPAFDEVYAGIAERIAPLRLADMVFARRDVFEVACNWKTYVDNFLEGYHLPLVHPTLTGMVDYGDYEVELHPWHSRQHTPVRNDSAGAFGDGEANYFFIFPNIMLNVMPGRLQTNRVVPLGPRRCRVDFDYFYLPTPEAQARIEPDRVVNDQIQHQDMAICEVVQRGLESGYYDAGRLSPKRERGVWHFHEHLRRAYASDRGDGQ